MWALIKHTPHSLLLSMIWNFLDHYFHLKWVSWLEDVAGSWAKWQVIVIKVWPQMWLMVMFLCSSWPQLSLPNDLGWLIHIFSRSLLLQDPRVRWHDFLHWSNYNADSGHPNGRRRVRAVFSWSSAPMQEDSQYICKLKLPEYSVGVGNVRVENTTKVKIGWCGRGGLEAELLS